ncbi:MATE family efflux transporter [Halanaerobium saccharolyticum]|uniref:MATE family efflux transporter n=1 Tax=Halanaerobium saccharolyticum TaxID=43595 RepID=UPI003FCEBF85
MSNFLLYHIIFIYCKFNYRVGIIFSRELMGAMTFLMEESDPFILNQGSTYLNIVLASMLFGLPMMVVNAILQGIGDMKTPLFIMFISNVVNVLFNLNSASKNTESSYDSL